MQRSLKRIFCLFLVAVLTVSLMLPAFAATEKYNYKVKSNLSSSLYVRPDASTNYASIGSLAPGTRIYVSDTVYNDGRNWGKITYNGREGWVCIDYCESLDSVSVVTPEIPSSMKVDWTVIDISKFQSPSEIDWSKLKAAGVKGVIIRIGGRGVVERTVYADSSFMTHYDNATSEGLYVGAYFFSYALNAAEAKEEADFVVKTLKNNNCKLLMPVFIDIEDYSEGNFTDLKHREAGTAACDSVVNTFCDTVKAAGYYPGIYCNLDYTKSVLSPSVFSGRAVWIAQWNSSCDYDGTYHMWQYTDKGKINGYSKPLDVSKCYMNFPKLISEGQTQNPSVPSGKEDDEYYGDHTASDWKIKKQATCSEAGERIKICTDSGCGITLVSEVIQPSFSSHSRSAQFVSLVDTDIKAGDKLSSSQLNYLHSATEKSSYGVTYEDACKTSGGVMLTYCKTCKTVMTVSYYAKSNCNHSDVNKTETVSTCSKCGTETDTCKACGFITSTKLVSPLSHNPTLKDNTATCSKDGEKIYKCSLCSETVRTEFSPQTYHSFTLAGAVIRPEIYDGTVSVKIRCKNCSEEIVFDATFGDTEGKGSVAVSDARNALRSAVQLDKLTTLQTVAADIDMDGSVSVSDARYILRIAVQLDNAKDLYNKFIAKSK